MAFWRGVRESVSRVKRREGFDSRESRRRFVWPGERGYRVRMEISLRVKLRSGRWGKTKWLPSRAKRCTSGFGAILVVLD